MAQPNITVAEHPNSSELQRASPAPFLTKTYELVDDSDTDQIISWNEFGSAFVVWHPPEFARDLLPNFFKHNNFSSFVRQLNTYGFKKIVPDRWEFAHEFFRKGERHLLIDIHRRKTVPLVPLAALPVKRPVSPSKSGDEQATSCSSSPPCSPRERITSSTTAPDEYERLKKENMLLAAEVSCLRRLCTDLVLYIQKYTRGSGEDLSYMRVFHSSSMACSGLEPPTLDERVMTGQELEALQLKLDSSNEDVQLNASSPHDMVFSLCESSSQRDPPKLFGVPLPCRRRRGSGTEEQQCTFD